MTELFEPMAIGTISDSKLRSIKCDHSAPTTSWKLKLDGDTGQAADESGSGGSGLRGNILRDRKIQEPVWPPPSGVESKNAIKPGKPGTWPHQAHHLIPHVTLKKHGVRQYLQAGWKQSKLLSDANYSVNHGRNGKFLPYVSPLKEWKSASSPDAKQEVAEEVMEKLKLQLHQGPHSSKSYGAGKTGYKKMVTELLNGVRLTEYLHQKSCTVCAAASSNKEYPPRKAVTLKLDWVSGKLEKAINSNSIFVSKRAFFWWEDN